MTDSIAAAADDLDATHEVLTGLLDALDSVTRSMPTNRPCVSALTCAMHRYLDDMGNIIERVQGISMTRQGGA